jgi:predicted phosphoribosyltransferase
MRYRDRNDAGERLASAVEAAGVIGLDVQPLVLGIPRGGVPVAALVAERMGGDLDVLVAHKLGAPGNPEYAIGAVAEDGTLIVDDSVIERLGIDLGYVDAERRNQQADVERRAAVLRAGRPPTPLAGRVCVVVDDGVATGATLEASLRLVERSGAARVVAAVPVGPTETVVRLAGIVDAVVCPLQPTPFVAVGEWYDDFRQVGEDTVIETLGRFRPSG